MQVPDWPHLLLVIKVVFPVLADHSTTSQNDLCTLKNLDVALDRLLIANKRFKVGLLLTVACRHKELVFAFASPYTLGTPILYEYQATRLPNLSLRYQVYFSIIQDAQTRKDEHSSFEKVRVRCLPNIFE